MAQQKTGGRIQKGQTSKDRVRPEAEGTMGPLEMLMDMFNLAIPEAGGTGVTEAQKGPPAAGSVPGVRGTTAPANTMGWGPDGSLISSPPPFQPMDPAAVNMAAEQAAQAGDMAQQVQQWDPFGATAPTSMGPARVPFPQMSPRTMQEAPVEQAYNPGARAAAQPMGVPAPNMPLPQRNPALSDAGTPQMQGPPSKDPMADALEQQLIRAGGVDVGGNYGQFGYGSAPYPMGQSGADAIQAFMTMLARGM